MIKPWKFIARKHVFQHPRLQLAEDTVALPNGKEISYLREVPAKTHSVAIIAVNADGHILLQKNIVTRRIQCSGNFPAAR